MVFYYIVSEMGLIKEINKLRKEINRLLSKGMSSISWKVPIEKNWLSQNFDFLSLKKLLNVNLKKNETELKMQNPTRSFRETNLVLQLI